MTEQPLLAYTTPRRDGYRVALHALPCPRPDTLCLRCPLEACVHAGVTALSRYAEANPPLVRPLCLACAAEELAKDARPDSLHITETASTSLKATLRLHYALFAGVYAGMAACPALYAKTEQPYPELTSVLAYCDLPKEATHAQA